eukprot:2536367-Rhodomonas_salina.1
MDTEFIVTTGCSNSTSLSMLLGKSRPRPPHEREATGRQSSPASCSPALLGEIKVVDTDADILFERGQIGGSGIGRVQVRDAEVFAVLRIEVQGAGWIETDAFPTAVPIADPTLSCSRQPIVQSTSCHRHLRFARQSAAA